MTLTLLQSLPLTKSPTLAETLKSFPLAAFEGFSSVVTKKSHLPSSFIYAFSPQLTYASMLNSTGRSSNHPTTTMCRSSVINVLKHLAEMQIMSLFWHSQGLFKWVWT